MGPPLPSGSLIEGGEMILPEQGRRDAQANHRLHRQRFRLVDDLRAVAQAVDPGRRHDVLEPAVEQVVGDDVPRALEPERR